MATSFASFYAILIFFSITSLATVLATAIVASQRMIVKLIHRDSVVSPYHNQNASTSDHVEQSLTSSIANFTNIRTKFETNLAPDDGQTGVVADNTGLQFLAALSIGDPPSSQLVSLDTASNLLWVQCVPCTSCFKQSGLILDPSKSSTFTNLSCKNSLCFSTGGQCPSDVPCPYSVSYADGVTSSGSLARDYFTFNTSGNTMKIPLVFGCGNENEGSTDGQQSGILGLAPGNVSLVSQMGSKFSYCFGNISDPNYSHSQLVLGHGAQFLDSSTPLDTFNDLYYVALEGISVGDKRLIIDPFSFRRTPSGNGGVILDSATTITWLASGAFYPLCDEVNKLLGKSLVQKRSSSSSRLCYKGIVSQDLDGFPEVRFHFVNGADLVVDKWSMFHQTKENEFCMAVMETKVQGFSIIGVMAQQFHNVGYDIIGQKVYFKRINCENMKN